MKRFAVSPEICMIDTCDEFIDRFKIGKDDLIITIEAVWARFFKDIEAGEVIYLEKYGTGEPNDKMIEAISMDIKTTYKRVVAIGGGTVLDCAKLFALKSLLPLPDLFEGKIKAERDKELVLLPTTCGTGSEITNISILEFISKKTKIGLASDALYADSAVLIPELLADLPFKVFAASSIDALVHASASYLSPNASEISKMFSIKSINTILKGYMKIADEGKEVLSKLLPEFCLASALAGIAFVNAGCAAVHAMSYPLGARFHIPHGESNYAMFTGVFKKYSQLLPEGDIKEFNALVAQIIECGTGEVYERLEELLNSSILQKRKLREYGMTEDMIEEFADSVIKNQQRLLKNNYISLDRNDIMDIYSQLL